MLVRQLKADATRQLIAENRHPLAQFARPGATPTHLLGSRLSQVFCFTDADVTDEVDYVRRNPIRAGLKPQDWSFVTSYRSP